MQTYSRGFLLACATFLLVAVFAIHLVQTAQAAERNAIVTLNSGRQLKGEVVADDITSITIRISGINTKIKRSDIKSVNFLKTTDEEYKDRRAKVENDDVNGRYKIARWLYDQKSYTLALKELNELVKLAPNDDRIGLLRRVVVLKLGDNTPDTKPVPDPDPKPDKGDGKTEPVDVGPLPTKMLDEESVNRIKVYEIDFTAKPKLIIPRNVLEDFIKDYSKEPGVPSTPNEKRVFFKKKPDEQLKAIFEARARDYYGKVQVKDDPPAFADFRQKVHRNVVVNYCATAKCHGGENAGKMFLFNKNANGPTTIYTNFYILNKYKNDVGYMIDRGYPEKSLLLTYALPRNATALPHPNVPGWRPKFASGTSDRLYQTVLQWVPKLFRPEPQYGVEYKVPTLPSRLKKPADDKDDKVGDATKESDKPAETGG